MRQCWYRGSRQLLAMSLLMAAVPSFAAVTCSVSTSSSTLNFMTYDPLAVGTAALTVTVTCDNNPPPGNPGPINWSVFLSNGSSGICLGATGRTMQRQPALDATIGYNIYQGATTTVWGNAGCGTYPSGTFNITGNNSDSVSLTLTGRLPAGQMAPAGNYADSLLLTVSF